MLFRVKSEVQQNYLKPRDQLITSETFLLLTVGGSLEFLDLAAIELFEAGALGIEEFEGTLRVYPEDNTQLASFERRLRSLVERLNRAGRPSDASTAVKSICNDWQDKWLKALGPETITQRFTFRPTHCRPAPSNETTLWFEAMISFGSGQHPSTKLAARFVEQFVDAHPLARCLDVGTGTGVLSLVAARCGTGVILAVDTSPVAVESTKNNIRLNELEDRITVQIGSADLSTACFDLVMANINTVILLGLAELLFARVAPGGTLMLAGLLEEEFPELSERFSHFKLELCEELSLEGWGLQVWQRES